MTFLTNRSEGRLTGVVLAGGMSVRMGRDKALLPIGDTIFASCMVRLLRQGCNDVLIVGGDPRRFEGTGVRAVADRVPGLGPLGGICTALERTAGDILAVACDVPHLQASDLRSLSTHDRRAADATVFAVGSARVPLPVLVRRPALPRLTGYLAQGGRSIRGFLDRLTVSEISIAREASESFVSINTPAEYDQLLLK